MFKNYDAIIVVGSYINLDGSLKEDVRLRVERALDLYFLCRSDTLLMSGRCGTHDKDAVMTEAEAMKKYAVERGFLEEIILEEENSLDTIGQVYFIKRDFVLPRNWRRFIMVSSSFHVDRVKAISDFIFGGGYDITHDFVVSDLSGDSNIVSHERKKLEIFYELFRGIDPGDDDAITERLFSKHELYNH